MSSQSNTALQTEVDRLRVELQTMKGEQKAAKISIGNYILSRLEQLGVTVSFMVSAATNIVFIYYGSPCLVFLATSILGFW
jgi:pyruvate decarboxylase